MREKIMNAVLFALLLWLLIVSPRHPWPDWIWPSYCFSLAGLIWQAPEIAKLLSVPGASMNDTNRHETIEEQKDE